MIDIFGDSPLSKALSSCLNVVVRHAFLDASDTKGVNRHHRERQMEIFKKDIFESLSYEDQILLYNEMIREHEIDFSNLMSEEQLMAARLMR